MAFFHVCYKNISCNISIKKIFIFFFYFIIILNFYVVIPVQNISLLYITKNGILDTGQKMSIFYFW